MERLPANNDVKDGKLLAVIAHFWLIGTVVAWVLNLKKNNSFTSFYVRQMIGWHLLTFLNGFIVLKILRIGFLKWILGVILFIFLLMSFFSAFSGKKSLTPFFGEKFQEWFKSL